MDCKEIRELLPDLAAGMEVATPEVRKHLASCDACSTQFHDFQKTMALLDEWQAPEPSAYFDTRLQARLREEMARPAESWLRRMMPGRYFRPAWAALAAAVVLMAALAIGNRTYFVETEAIATGPPRSGCRCSRGRRWAICRRWTRMTNSMRILTCSTNCKCRTMARRRSRA